MSNLSNSVIITSAKNTIALQANALEHLTTLLTDDFEKAVQLVAKAQGRLVVSGIGKSAIIAQKIVATLNSTGTPALFMHAADAIHGDLGMIQQHDVVMIISKSGDSPEIKLLVPFVKNFGNPIIGMVGNMQSFLAKNCTLAINTSVAQEACPNNLAPTTSTTAQMVMGDALAICLMETRQFSSGDFAKFHPGGMLGKKLYLRVHELIDASEKPEVEPGSDIKTVLLEITSKRLGATAVVLEQKLIGIITDGDIRRMLEKHDSFSHLKAADIMHATPKTIDATALVADAYEILKAANVNQLVVMQDDKYAGILHIQEILREGIL